MLMIQELVVQPSNRIVTWLSTQYLGVWAPAQNYAAAAPAAGRGSIGQRKGGVGAGAVSPSKGF